MPTWLLGGDGVATDIVFHRTIAQATSNPFFLQTVEFLSQYVMRAVRVTRANEALRVEFMRQVRDEHCAIVEAIRRQDAVAARMPLRPTCSMPPGDSPARPPTSTLKPTLNLL